MTKLKLTHDLVFEDLYQLHGLEKIDSLFQESLSTVLKSNLCLIRQQPQAFSDVEASSLLIKLGESLEFFIAELFGITQASTQRKHIASNFNEIYKFKRGFIERKALKKCPKDVAKKINGPILREKLEQLIGANLTDSNYLNLVDTLKQQNDEENLGICMQYAAWACFTIEGRIFHKESSLFITPEKSDLSSPFPIESFKDNEVNKYKTPSKFLSQRDGFQYTNEDMSFEQSLEQAHYCIKCHTQAKDSCSKGLSGQADKAGCPLGVKISEMNILHQNGLSIAALAMIMIDNPMVAATGDRICNDCSKACIFQRQTPVNVPSIESSILNQVLSMPWGFEVYSLLSKWNPLNIKTPLPKCPTGKTVMITGIGPAGFTLAHYMLNDGHQVIAIDALKINPLENSLKSLVPIQNIQEFFEPLEERNPAGFGGVAEYGITVRWNKNYLKIIRALLERREQFNLIESTRLGSQLTASQAFEKGIDHIAICAGAGQPQIPQVKNLFSKGVRFASDFLMTLQLNAASKQSSPTNLQMRMPVVVIGAGLTAVDTATEAQAYYIRQVESFAAKYRSLTMSVGQLYITQGWSKEEKTIAEEFLNHANQIEEERLKAQEENRNPDFTTLLNNWGGVSILYRKPIESSPSFRLNHHELFEAMKEGIKFIYNAEPLELNSDRFGNVEDISVSQEGLIKRINARSVFIATGTKPNEETLQDSLGCKDLKMEGFFVRDLPKNQSVSIHGDLNNDFSGSVVKAMASAKQAAPLITEKLNQLSKNNMSANSIVEIFKAGLKAHVVDIIYLNDRTYEIIVKAPFAAENFKAGQFFRIQNYPNFRIPHSVEGIAVTGASVNKHKGTISLIVLVSGSSSYLLKDLQKGDPVSIMGPTGKPTQIVKNQNVILSGGGLGNAVLFSIAKELKLQGCKILYFAAYRESKDIFKKKEIEAYADQVIWCLESLINPPSIRPNDKIFKGKITEALKQYALKNNKNPPFKFDQAERMISIGSDKMMAALHHMASKDLAGLREENFKHICSINSPMQCMMKEVCGQCIQRHLDPNTGVENFVFSCVNQDQNADFVDFTNLQMRLGQNSLLEKLNYQWIKHEGNKEAA